MAKKPNAMVSPKAAQDDVLGQMGEDIEAPKDKKPEPMFKIIGASKIPVSKAFGRNVERRKDASLKAYEMVRDAINEVYRYYNHNQVKDDISSRGDIAAKFRQGDGSENIVYANVSTLVPATYSKNPEVAFSTEQDEDKPFVEVLGKAVNAILNKKAPLGINLKPRAKKAVLHAELANMGVLKLEYIRKDDSREEAQAEMEALYKQMEDAKDQGEVQEIEGMMMALESQMEWREPSGLKLSTVIPLNLIVDPFAENEDGTDANWMLEKCFLPTDYINARFTNPDGDKDCKERKLIYKPSHKVKLEGPGSREDALGLVLEQVQAGETSKEEHSDEERLSYIYQNMTMCWWYWDKTTRRIYLFADNDFTWPIWVWEDDIKTSRFFPYFLIAFSPSTGGAVSPSEVSYYLDQQDELNKINKEIVRMRRLAFSVLMYNKNKITPGDAQKVINYLKTGEGEIALGVDVPDGQVIKDCVETIVPPSMNFEQLFNKQDIYRAVGQIGSASDVLKGQQFKTNTTNKAIETYTSAAKLRLDNRTDCIEDCIADLAWTIGEILVSNYSDQQIAGLVGEKKAKDWQPKSIEELNATCSVIVAAGSSEKPTSDRKKEQAIKVAQAVGQFAKGAPVSSMMIVIKMLQKAFPELDVTDEDWARIIQEMQMMGQQQAQAEGQPNGEDKSKEDIKSKLNNLPPETKAQVLKQVNAGVSPQQALAPHIKEAQNAPAR